MADTALESAAGLDLASQQSNPVHRTGLERKVYSLKDTSDYKVPETAKKGEDRNTEKS